MPACLPLTAQMIESSLVWIRQHLSQCKQHGMRQPVNLGRSSPLIVYDLQGVALSGTAKHGTSEMRAFTTIEPACTKDQMIRA